MAELTAIRRYPVKGLQGEALERVTLSPGAGLPGDRRFALVPTDSFYDAGRAGWAPKTAFATLMREAGLARLACRTELDGRLALLRDGRRVAVADPDRPEETGRIARFVSGFLDTEIALARAEGVSFTDTPEPLVSILNLESVRAFEAAVGRPVDPLRFRANLHVDALPAWSETAWAGRVLGERDVRLEVLEPIVRCAATNVDPAAARVDMNVPADLADRFGHVEMGVYARVLAGGTLTVGDRLAPEADTRPGAEAR